MVYIYPNQLTGTRKTIITQTKIIDQSVTNQSPKYGGGTLNTIIENATNIAILRPVLEPFSLVPGTPKLFLGYCPHFLMDVGPISLQLTMISERHSHTS